MKLIQAEGLIRERKRAFHEAKPSHLGVIREASAEPK